MTSLPFIDANGLVWANGGEDTDDHLSHGGHETALVQIAKSLLPEGGTFLDIGAHVGLYTLNLALKASHVYAIEANPKTYETLLSNIKANAATHEAEVHSVNLAAWDSFETLSLIDANDKETGGSTRCESNKHRSRFDPATAQGMPLDEALPEACMPDLVKIDVEGAEARVLRGMREVINANRPVLFIEMHDKVYGKPKIREEVFQFLRETDYRWDDSLTHGDECYYVIAKPMEQGDEFEIDVVKAGVQSEPEDESFKCSYRPLDALKPGVLTTAYIDGKNPDGSYYGTNKHTDEPVTVRWNEAQEQWMEEKK